MSDILTDVIAVINTKWVEPPTKPSIIDKVFNYKNVSLYDDEAILVSVVSEDQTPAGIGATYYFITSRVSCDIMTAVTRERVIELKDELTRCFREEIHDNKEWVHVISVNDMCNDLRKLYRIVVDIEWKFWEQYT